MFDDVSYKMVSIQIQNQGCMRGPFGAFSFYWSRSYGVYFDMIFMISIILCFYGYIKFVNVMVNVVKVGESINLKVKI